MAKTIAPEKWAKFFQLWNQGYDKGQAARAAGISLPTIRAGLRGDEGSSIHRYREWKAAQKPCPTCGRVG